MSFETKGQFVTGTHTLDELKLVYRVLHAHLTDHLELMDTQFLIDLQSFLQQRARADGVDPSHHSAWDEWLGNAGAPDCEERVKRRKTIDPPGA